jgi:hypothetical protein
MIPLETVRRTTWTVTRSSLICGKFMIWREAPMRFEQFSFGHITIDGVTYDHDVIIDYGKIRKRVKKPSKKLRGAFAY